jgi:hypothetical protein
MGIRGSRGGDVPVKRRRRHTEAVRDLGNADIGIRQQCPGDIKIVFSQLWWAASGAARAPRRREARLGALSDQAALEFRQRAKHVKNQPPLRSRRVESFGPAAK